MFTPGTRSMATQLFDLALSRDGGAFFLAGALLAASVCAMVRRRRREVLVDVARVDDLPLPCWILDDAGTVVGRSRRAPDPSAGASFTGGAWSGEDSRRVAAALEEARTSGQARVRRVTEREGVILGALEIARRLDDAGRFAGWVVQVGVPMEAEDPRSSQAADPRRERLALVGRLAAGTAHEFNNILTSVLGYAELLRRQLSEEAPERLDVDEIRTAARQGSELTRLLLGFARGRSQPRAPVDLVPLLDGLLRLLESSFDETVALTVEHEPSSAFVLADVHGLENLVVDLILALRPVSRAAGDRVRVTIDRRAAPGTGAGSGRAMLEEFVLHFERDLRSSSLSEDEVTAAADLLDPATFERASRATQAIGGRLVRGRASFELALPGVEPVHPEEAGPQEGFEVGDGELVLVVEDEWLVRRLISTGLRQAGFRVIDASSAQEALAVLDEHGEPLDLLVSDIVLPGAGGVELAERLVERFPRLRVLFISGYGEGAGAGDWDRIAGAAFLAKPFAPADLLGRIQSLLGRRG